MLVPGNLVQDAVGILPLILQHVVLNAAIDGVAHQRRASERLRQQMPPLALEHQDQEAAHRDDAGQGNGGDQLDAETVPPANARVTHSRPCGEQGYGHRPGGQDETRLHLLAPGSGNLSLTGADKPSPVGFPDRLEFSPPRRTGSLSAGRATAGSCCCAVTVRRAAWIWLLLFQTYLATGVNVVGNTAQYASRVTDGFCSIAPSRAPARRSSSGSTG